MWPFLPLSVTGGWSLFLLPFVTTGGMAVGVIVGAILGVRKARDDSRGGWHLTKRDQRFAALASGLSGAFFGCIGGYMATAFLVLIVPPFGIVVTVVTFAVVIHRRRRWRS